MTQYQQVVEYINTHHTNAYQACKALRVHTARFRAKLTLEQKSELLVLKSKYASNKSSRPGGANDIVAKRMSDMINATEEENNEEEDDY